jgi:hypothetical protein
MRLQRLLTAQQRQGSAASLLALAWAASFFCAILGSTVHAAQLQPELEALQAFEQARAEISAQRYDRAEILLERVLMLHPEHAEARIELALLMARRGHSDGAQALVQSLIDDPRTEPEYTQALRALKAQIGKGPHAAVNPYALDTREAAARLAAAAQGTQASAQPAAQSEAPADPSAKWRGEASLTASSNPLARTSSGAITITLPDGPLSLPLSQTAQSGALTGLSLSRTTATHGAELALQRADVSGTTTAARALAWVQLPLKQWLPDSLKPDLLPPVLAYVQAQRGLDGQHRAMAGLTTVLGAQRLSLSHYEEYGMNDHGTVVRAEHNQPRLWGADWQASIEHSNSAVGPQGYWRTGLSAERALGDGRKLLAQLTHQQDTYAYSALLQNGVNRRLTTAYVAFEQHVDLKREKVLIWRVFSGERRSNLELFNYNELGAQLSVVQNWR